MYEGWYFKKILISSHWELFDASTHPSLCALTDERRERERPMTVPVDMPGGNMHRYDLNLLFYLAKLSPDLIFLFSFNSVTTEEVSSFFSSSDSHSAVVVFQTAGTWAFLLL